ncbi:MAG: Flavodoxin reductase [Myxococcaceae bacterium]|nr:Flavodoxin reductase [Myxococcaceae bacterium]
MRLAELHVYPLKGARGIALEQAEMLPGGLRHDRRFMLLDARGEFVTQRKHPRMALVTTALDDARLAISTPGAGTFELALALEGPRRIVRIWDDDVEAVEIGGAVAEALSDHLGERCALVAMPDDVVRPVEAPYGAPGDRVGFADAYPVLLATRASLAELNARLSEPVPMNRFRPNLVIEGGDAFEEEAYGRVRIGPLTFRMPKRCSRCAVTVVDQDTAIAGKEPLRTLAKYRTVDNNVYFAQNLIPDGLDGDRSVTLHVGDEATYLESLR